MKEFFYWNFRRHMSWFPHWLAARMPKWIVYYCTIRLVAHATGSKYPTQIVPELTAMDALKRWELT